MASDSGVTLESLKVDGGMVANDLLTQFQADILGVPVIRPEVAGPPPWAPPTPRAWLWGFWSSEDEVGNNRAQDKRWERTMAQDKRDEYYKYWKKAVTRTFDSFD